MTNSAIEQSQLLINNPSESLSVEMKTWFDPQSFEGKALLVKALFALRNNNGGFLIVGFDNKTLAPSLEGRPENVAEVFHPDKIQYLVSQYASSPFEVSVEFVPRNNQLFPVVRVPAGVVVPVSVKSELRSPDGKVHLKAETFFVRTLNANNIVSTAPAIWKDWSRLLDICFDNREADIGRFLRRQIGGLGADGLRNIISELSSIGNPVPAKDPVDELLDDGRRRYDEAVAKLAETVPVHAAYEAAMVIRGDLQNHRPNSDFMNLLAASNPRFSGWPIWLDSRGFADETLRPRVIDGAWQTMIVRLDTGWTNGIDFMRMDPKGKFYLYQNTQDDFVDKQRVGHAGRVLDFALPVFRVTETIAVGLAYARAMGATEGSVAAFKFRWSNLMDRELVSWAETRRHIFPGRKSYSDTVDVRVDVPVDTPLAALGGYVEQVMKPLYELFNGFSIGTPVIEELAKSALERRF